ncbi:DUF885 domain-containing protein [Pseudoxanthomonas kaohsiungensis]|uniref:DUF885 domain-containing protein n=1 Tax=Pseudoxanthomonas kaohsiungensis TaxID=283923 RepID=A0ABW3LZ12_9GAMM|nr:DUF885 family protein [Pseudoxanthomonas kaohsiungensis]KAF1704776.1 DUF885 domain-containing protein [Pseudoxanthomonas kaohsiungensis]
MIRPLAVALLLALSLPTAIAAHAGPPVAATANEVDARFEAIYGKEWTWRQAQNGLGDEDSVAEEGNLNPRLPDVSAAAQQARLDVWSDVLRQLDALDTAQLSEANRINLAIYRAQVQDLADDVRLRGYQMPFNSDSSFWSNLNFMARRPMQTAAAYRAYIARLHDVPRYFDQQVANMRDGLARGFSVPRPVLEGREGSIAAVADLEDPAASALYAPFKDLPARIPTAEQQALREAARAAIAESVIPAFARLRVFFHDEYVPRARTTLAASAMPDGKAWYRQQIRRYTTLDLTPQQIHRIGLDEVARIQGEMDAIIDQLGFEGGSEATRFQDFLRFLRTDPQFYVAEPQQLLDRAAWISKRVDGQIGRYIGTLPRGRFTIVPVPDDIAPFWTAGRGGLGTYWVNTYDLPSRPLYNLPALTLHESSPGHALQAALSQEQEALPAFRRDSYISAYGEGWALYTEKLGKEMGIYETPYEDFGRLTYEMWRASRLVIDTGIHHYGWSRDRALAYLRERTALSEHEITTEVDRYISWPGQALSYKLGEIAIVGLRARAEAELGERFDIRAFHDAILAEGSVPLPVLEARIGAFIDAARAGEPAGGSPRAP